uniref:Structure-specific endonuclease subunit SLX4 n=1 Tax=Photinus pyralis TaxID=7054 RepID=A0A1Y1NHH5_PHOPY
MENCSISNYFKSKQDCENVTRDEDLNSSSDSPYKNILTNIQVDLNSSNEGTDFKTPKHFNNPKKIQPKAKPSVTTKKSTKKKLHLRRQPRISSFTNCVETDTNREHMDMAIAMSRSLQNQCADGKFMLGLEQFAFKPGGSKLSVGNRRPVSERRKDKPKKYITPVLMLRTREEREEIINTKISDLLLCDKPSVQTFYESVTLVSSMLQRYFKPDRSLFKMSDLLCCDFYVEHLNLDPSRIKCGSLLKDWHKIPGRSVSPVNRPLADSPNKTETCIKDFNKKVCTSPELFDSDDDNLYYMPARKSPANGEESSESLLTPRKSNLQQNSMISNSKEAPESKLEHKEEDCFDLTQSSSSESNTSNKGQLQTGISDVFQNVLNVDESDLLDGVHNLGETYRNRSVQWPRDTLDELFDNEINLSAFTRNQNSPVFTNSFKSEESIVISDDEINYSCNHGVGGVLEGSLSFTESNSDLGPLEENDGLNDTILYTVPTANECNTPKSEMIIKTTNVTPGVNYNEMDTPKITRELEKFGIKPLKRKHGIKLLDYIYNSTHPVLSHTDVVTAREGLAENVTKKRKTVTCKRALIAEKLSINEDFGEGEELIFEKTHSKRIASCQIPLHIVWHNLVASDPNLQKSILLYEPLNLQLLYKTLKMHGYKFHIQVTTK